MVAPVDSTETPRVSRRGGRRVFDRPRRLRSNRGVPRSRVARTFLTSPEGPALATTRWATRPARRTTRAGAAAGRRALALRDANFAAPGAATAETVKALMSSVARRGQRARCAAASRVAFWINSSTLFSEKSPGITKTLSFFRSSRRAFRFRFRERHTGQPDRFSRSSSKKGAGCAFRKRSEGVAWHSFVKTYGEAVTSF
jgi:hypothetical protein